MATQIRIPTWEEGHRGDTAEVQKTLKGVEKVVSEWVPVFPLVQVLNGIKWKHKIRDSENQFFSSSPTKHAVKLQNSPSQHIKSQYRVKKPLDKLIKKGILEPKYSNYINTPWLKGFWKHVAGRLH